MICLKVPKTRGGYELEGMYTSGLKGLSVHQSVDYFEAAGRPVAKPKAKKSHEALANGVLMCSDRAGDTLFASICKGRASRWKDGLDNVLRGYLQKGL